MMVNDNRTFSFNVLFVQCDPSTKNNINKIIEHCWKDTYANRPNCLCASKNYNNSYHE